MFRDEAALKEELVQAGYRPAPFAFFLHSLRRLVWPVIRQYHHYSLEALAESHSRLETMIAAERRRVEEVTEECRLLRRDLHRSLSASAHERLVFETEIVRLRQEISESTVPLHHQVEKQLGESRLRSDEQFAQIHNEVRTAAERSQNWLLEMQKLVPVLTALRSDVAALGNREQVLGREFHLFKAAVEEQIGREAQADSLLADDLQELVKAQEQISSRLSEIDRIRSMVEQRDIAERARLERLDQSVSSSHSALIEQLTRLRDTQTQLFTRLGEAEKWRTAHEELYLADRERLAESEHSRSRAFAQLVSQMTAVHQEHQDLAAKLADLDLALNESRAQDSELQSKLRESVEQTRAELARSAARFDSLRQELADVDALRQELAAVRETCQKRFDTASPGNGSIVTSAPHLPPSRPAHASFPIEDLEARMAAATRDAEQFRTRVQAEVASLQARVESVLARMPDQYRDAVYHSALATAEIKAEVAVLRAGFDRMSASDAHGTARIAEVERRTAALDAIATRESEMAILERELEWRSRVYIRQTNGGLFILKRGDLISDHVASGQVWDPHVIEVARQVASEKRGVAIDVGGHIGLTAAALARMFDKVITFEPNTFNYSFIMANMALNRLNNVECIGTALFSRDCEISLGSSEVQETPLHIAPGGNFDGLGSSNLGALVFTEHGTGVFRHNARTLDSFNFDNVNFMKIDAQGADGEVLFGAVETLKRCKPVLVFEWETYLASNFSRTFEQVEVLLKSIGYSVDLLYRSTDKQADYIARCV